MPDLAAAYADLLAKNPDLMPFALGSRPNLAQLDLTALGAPVAAWPAEDHPDRVESYLRLNHLAFPALPVPRWVLSDLYLMPGAIVGFAGDRRRLGPEARAAAGPGEPALLAAWVGAPTVFPGTLVGVSLFSFSAGLGPWAKLLGTQVLRATSLRGMTQWTSPALRAHTRLGPLHILGPAPGGHELGELTFAYATNLTPQADLAACFLEPVARTGTITVASSDHATLRRLTEHAAGGARVVLLPPGLDRAGNLHFDMDGAL
jgi:hypothetical protein